jgi:hypothetical protein
MEACRIGRPLSCIVTMALAVAVPFAAHADFEITGYTTTANASTFAFDSVQIQDEDSLLDVGDKISLPFNPSLNVISTSPGNGESSMLAVGGFFSVLNEGLQLNGSVAISASSESCGNCEGTTSVASAQAVFSTRLFFTVSNGGEDFTWSARLDSTLTVPGEFTDEINASLLISLRNEGTGNFLEGRELTCLAEEGSCEKPFEISRNLPDGEYSLEIITSGSTRNTGPAVKVKVKVKVMEEVKARVKVRVKEKVRVKVRVKVKVKARVEDVIAPWVR